MWISKRQGAEWCAMKCHLDLTKDGTEHDCAECGREWRNLRASVWQSRLKLDHDAPWEVELVQVVMPTSKGRPARKYLLTNPLLDEGKPNKRLIVPSVSDVLQGALGASETLVNWSVREGLFSMLELFIAPDFLEDVVKKEYAKDPITKRPRKFGDVIKMLPVPMRQRAQHLTLDSLAEPLDRAAWAHHRTKRKAGELGTRCHELIQYWLLWGGEETEAGYAIYVDQERENGIFVDQEPAPVQRALEAFWRFWTREALEVRAIELAVCNSRTGMGGTLDVITEDPTGEEVIVDWKTGNGTWAKFLLQVGFYVSMYERQTGRWPRAAYIVRIDKETAQLQITPVYRTREEYLALLDQCSATLNTYRWHNWAEDYIASFPPENAPREETPADANEPAAAA